MSEISYIGYTPEKNASYAVQYQEAFVFLFNNRNNAKAESKNIDLPLLYLLRHYLELSFKYNIEYFKDYSGKKDYLKQLNYHYLDCLFLAFRLHFNESLKRVSCNKELKNEIKTYFIELKKLVDTLSKLDNSGESFRYSDNKKGVININSDVKINLIEEIGKPYENSKNLLDYSINVYEDLLKINPIQVKKTNYNYSDEKSIFNIICIKLQKWCKCS